MFTNHMLLSYLINAPYQHTISPHPIETRYQHNTPSNRSMHLLHNLASLLTSSKCSTSTSPFNDAWNKPFGVSPFLPNHARKRFWNWMCWRWLSITPATNTNRQVTMSWTPLMPLPQCVMVYLLWSKNWVRKPWKILTIAMDHKSPAKFSTHILPWSRFVRMDVNWLATCWWWNLVPTTSLLSSPTPPSLLLSPFTFQHLLTTIHFNYILHSFDISLTHFVNALCWLLLGWLMNSDGRGFCHPKRYLCSHECHERSVRRSCRRCFRR